MSIINIQNGVVTPSVEQKQGAKRTLITGQINSSFQQVVSDFKLIFDEVWNSSDLTPQEVIDAFGTDAAQLFQIAGSFKDAINAVVPNTIPDGTPKDFTINQDGTVTIKE